MNVKKKPKNLTLGPKERFLAAKRLFLGSAGENPKGNKEIWESRERCRLLSLRN